MHKYNFKHTFCINGSTDAGHRTPLDYAFLTQLDAHVAIQEAIRHDYDEKQTSTKKTQKKYTHKKNYVKFATYII